MIDIIILTYCRPLQLERSLRCLNAAALHSRLRFKTRIVINGEDPDTVEALHRLEPALPSLDFETHQLSRRQTYGAARNVALAKCTAQWVYFIDDDAWVQPELFESFIRLVSERPQTAIAGGPNLSHPSMTPFQVLNGAVLALPFAAGPFAQRYRFSPAHTPRDDRALILCNLFVRRTTLGNYLFPARLTCAEENHLVHNLAQDLSTDQMVFDPSIGVFHERANSLHAFSRQILRYARGRGELLALEGLHSSSSRFVVLGILTGMTVMIASSAANLFVPSLIVYATAVLAHAIYASFRVGHVRLILPAVGMILILHSLYPAGLIVGLLSRSQGTSI